MLTVRQELCDIKLSGEAPDASIPIGDKFAVVYRDATFEHGKFGGCELDGYSGISQVTPSYMPPERYAYKPEEIGTVVIAATSKGAFIERAEARRTLSTKTDTAIYEGKVTINLVDRKSGKLARRISFTTRNVPQQVPQNRLKLQGSTYEYVCEPTAEQVRENLDRILQP